MKPAFANTFNITQNKGKSETAITFAHAYTEHNFSVTGGSLTDVSGQVCENVASVLLTREGTVALTKVLLKATRDMGIDLDEVN